MRGFSIVTTYLKRGVYNLCFQLDLTYHHGVSGLLRTDLKFFAKEFARSWHNNEDNSISAAGVHSDLDPCSGHS